MLQRVAVYAVCFCMLQRVAVYIAVLQYPSRKDAGHSQVQLWRSQHCNTLQHTATHCNTLQHTATHYIVGHSQVQLLHSQLPTQRKAQRLNGYAIIAHSTEGCPHPKNNVELE